MAIARRGDGAVVGCSRSGTPQEVYDSPTNLFVARFIGTPPMNTFDATVTTAEPPAWSSVVAGSRCRAGLTTRLEENRKVLAGVRPEHLVVGPSGSADGVQATVQNVEWLGHESLVNLRCRRAPGRHPHHGQHVVGSSRAR